MASVIFVLYTPFSEIKFSEGINLDVWCRDDEMLSTCPQKMGAFVGWIRWERDLDGGLQCSQIIEGVANTRFCGIRRALLHAEWTGITRCVEDFQTGF